MRNHHEYGESLPQHEFEIGTDVYRCIDIVHTGRNAVVLQLRHTQTEELCALKVWRSHATYVPYPVTPEQLTKYLGDVVGYEWLHDRVVLNQIDHADVLQKYPALTHSVLMPWFGSPTWCEFKYFYMHPEQPDKQKFFGRDKAPQMDILVYARAFAQMLTQMEERHCTHHDLSDSNILLDLQTGHIICVDVEDMSINKRPTDATSVLGTPGYQFSSNQESVVNDRFAGALLLCEVLCLPALKEAGLYDFDGFFTSYEVDMRNTSCMRYATLKSALGALSSQLAALFVRTWTATTPQDCPAFWEWDLALKELRTDTVIPKNGPFLRWGGKIGARSNTPGLIIFCVDLRASELEEFTNLSSIPTVLNALQAVLKSCMNVCIWGGSMIRPRYHIAVIGYGRNAVNLLAAFKPADQLPNTQFDTQFAEKHSIWQITELLEHIDTLDVACSPMLAQVDTSTTHMTPMFERVYSLLRDVIHEYRECPPPLVYHITQGHNYDGGDPAAVVEKIRALTTRYGHVNVATIYTGANIFALPDDIQLWSGVSDEASFSPGKRQIGMFLTSISSRIVSKHHFEFGHHNNQIQNNRYLLFPANTQLAVDAITAPGITRTA
jgi:hypothetical protein